MAKKEYYLTVHGHFYQPPRENPWLEAIEQQDSAKPFHDWNERITQECYAPNAVSRILSHGEKVLDIVNNYSLMSYNIGPTLLSWLEEFSPKAYERIIKADAESAKAFSGHGNAIAQVYNHIIMPLANEKDKYTQTIWGIKDFENRFGRKPEAIWLAETAIDYDTLKVLADCDIKYTILSPFQAKKIRPMDGGKSRWHDVSNGSIDPARAYRCYLKDGSDRYVDLFFYDGNISRAVAFENLLKDGEKFMKRLETGVAEARDYNQLVHIATDGESYGHHTHFGDMALSYVLKIKSNDTKLKITNYGEYLENNPPTYEVELHDVSSWSCSHGVGRWKEDCGCSTGAQAGWNQKWRAPLRNALDFLRDKLITIYEKEAGAFLQSPWETRNNYISVLLDRSEENINNFLEKESFKEKLSSKDKEKLMLLLEMQRNAMYMYTSCGWFFAEISGIETVQIMKYAARAMQIAEEFSEENLEEQFLNILREAKSNISEHGDGAEIYNKFVKPSVVSIKQVVNHWAISSLYEAFEDETQIYCYRIKRLDYKKIKRTNTSLIVGRIEIKSEITTEKHDMIFSLLHFGGVDFHCTIRTFDGNAEYHKIKEELMDNFKNASLTEVVRTLDKHFGKEYFTLKDLFLEERRKVINVLIKDHLSDFSQAYKGLYEKGKSPMSQMLKLGIDIPYEFKIASKYTLSRNFNDLFINCDDITNADVIQRALDIDNESKKLGVKLSKRPVEELFSKLVYDCLTKVALTQEKECAENTIGCLTLAETLHLYLDTSEAQNLYFNKIYKQIFDLMNSNNCSKADKDYIATVLNLGEKLNFNVEKGYSELHKIQC